MKRRLLLQAEKIKEQLDAGELTFDEAAMKFSTCSSSSRGGKLGKFSPGVMPPEFDEVVFSLVDTGEINPGEIPTPVALSVTPMPSVQVSDISLAILLLRPTDYMLIQIAAAYIFSSMEIASGPSSNIVVTTCARV